MKVVILVIVIFSFIAYSVAKDFFNETKYADIAVECADSEEVPVMATLNEEDIPEDAHYYVMGNKWFVITTTKALTGKAPSSLESIKSACFAEGAFKSGMEITGFGGNKALYECDDPYECEVNNMSTNKEWAANHGGTEDTVVWTDGEKYVLGVRCALGKKVWSLISTQNVPIDKKIKEEVLKIVKKFGFKDDDVAEIPRAGCPIYKPIVQGRRNPGIV